MNVWHVYRQGLCVGVCDFRLFWTLRSWFFAWMLRILTNAFAWVLLGRVVGSEDRVHYLLIGNAVSAGSSASLWASNAMTWFRYEGTHPLLVIAPGSVLAAVAGRTSIWMFNGIATASVSFMAMWLAFGVRPDPHSLPWVFVSIVAVCAGSFWFAVFMGALLTNQTRYRNIVLDISGMGMLACCGASVPITFWPAPIQWLAQCLPMTHGLIAIRKLLSTPANFDITYELGLELLVCMTWAVMSLSTVRRLFEAGRSDGSIEGY